MKNVFYNKNYSLLNFALILLFFFTYTSIWSQDSLNCTKIGQWAEGPCYTVEANENYTFVNNGSYLDILDTSDSTNFILISRYLSRGFIYDIKIKDTLVFLAINGIGLSIINISDINNPQEIGFLKLYGYYPKIELFQDKLYYSTYSLYLIDISDPKSPLLQKKYNTGWSHNNLKIRDNYLYIACGWRGFKIFDISYPDSLIEVYHNDNIYGYDVDLKNNYACLATGDSITILDISSPSEPITIGKIQSNTISTCRFYKDMIICGGYRLYSIDISDPSQLKHLYNFNLGVLSQDIFLKDNKIYVSDGSNGFILCSVNNEGRFSLYGTNNTSGYSMGIAVKDNIAYITQYNEGIKLIDISDLTSPKYLKSINEGSIVETIKIRDNYLFCSDSGLKIYDISDAKNPIEINYLDVNTRSYKFEVIGNTVYLASGKNGLTIIDISDLNNLTIISEINISGTTFGVDIKNNTAYIANNDGMHIFDISDPANPVEVKYYNGQKHIREIKVLENYVFIGSSSYGVKILDISNLDSISTIRYTNTGRGYSIIIEDSLAYVAAGNKGIIIFNITDIANPVKVGSYNTSGEVYDLALYDGHIFLADYNSGMTIIDFDICSALYINSLQQDISCYNQCDGSIQITGVENSVGTIRYLWSTGQTGSSIDGLCEGTYIVTITDDNECEIIDSFYISEPPELAFDNIVKNDITDTNSKGSIQVNISGGTQNYTFGWTGPNSFLSTSKNIDNLEAGCYTLTVTDANGCTLVSDEICIEDKRTAVEEIENDNDFQIYPNPAKNHINIFNKNSDFANSVEKIEIFDSSGLKVLEKNKETKTIDINKLNNGIYIVHLNISGQNIVKKLIIIK